MVVVVAVVVAAVAAVVVAVAVVAAVVVAAASADSKSRSHYVHVFPYTTIDDLRSMLSTGMALNNI